MRRKLGTDTKFPAQFAGNWLSVPGFAPREMLPVRRAPKTVNHPTGGRIMLATDSKVATVSFYINGAWETPRGRTMGTVTNPATGAVLAEVPYANASDVDTAVRAAHAAFLKWREVPVVDRVQVLYRYKALLDKYANELAAILTSENGKTMPTASSAPPPAPPARSTRSSAPPRARPY